MGIISKIINAALGVTDNSAAGNEIISGPNFSNPLLPYMTGKGHMYGKWSDPQIKDEDMYTGYVYAAINKRAQQTAKLARDYIDTEGNVLATQLARDMNRDLVHPYLPLIQNSTQFSTRQFWYEISTYLDLTGVYYLMAVRRSTIQPDGSQYIGFPQKFVLLNPYEIKRVIDNKTGEVAGYIETKHDGRYREIPPYQIIEFRQLNPFDRNQKFSILDAAKEGQFIVRQAGNYTRVALDGNLNSPGIINTDVQLDDEEFANFISRIRNHSEGEPLYSNGKTGIGWTPMQVNLSDAGLENVKELGLEQIITTTGISKTMLGIESKSTNRATSQVQQDEFLSSTIIPNIESILDFLNLDFQRNYSDDFQKYGYTLTIKSPVQNDYENDTAAVNYRQAEFNLAGTMISDKIDPQSAVQFAQGNISLDQVVFPKGFSLTPQQATADKPTTSLFGTNEAPKQIDEPKKQDNTPKTPNVQNNIKPSTPVNVTIQNDLGKELTESIKAIAEKQNLSQDQLNTLQSNILNAIQTKDAASKAVEGVEKEKVNDLPSDKPERQENALERVKQGIDDNQPTENLVRVYNDLDIPESDVSKIQSAKKKYLGQVQALDKKIIQTCVSHVVKNDYTADDMINDDDLDDYEGQLADETEAYWLAIIPILAMTNINNRNAQFKTNEKFELTQAIQDFCHKNGVQVSQSHVESVVNAAVNAGNQAQQKALQNTVAEMIQQAQSADPERFSDYFPVGSTPTLDEISSAIDKTGILDDNQRLYEKAQQMIDDGASRDEISQAIQDQYNDISEQRADFIADNETNRAYANSQYQSDKEFFNNVLGSTDGVYKQLYSNTDDPCEICAGVIDGGPIPFDDPFSDDDDTSTDEDNIFAAYGGVIHPNCNCGYSICDADGNELDIDALTSGDDSNDGGGDNDSDESESDQDGNTDDIGEDDSVSDNGNTSSTDNTVVSEPQAVEPEFNYFKDGKGKFTYKWELAKKGETFGKIIKRVHGRDLTLNGIKVNVKQILVPADIFKRAGIKVNARKNDKRVIKMYEALVKNGKTSKVYVSKNENQKYEILFGHHIAQAYYNHMKHGQIFNIPIVYSDDYEGLAKVAHKIEDADIIDVKQLNQNGVVYSEVNGNPLTKLFINGGPGSGGAREGAGRPKESSIISDRDLNNIINATNTSGGSTFNVTSASYPTSGYAVGGQVATTHTDAGHLKGDLIQFASDNQEELQSDARNCIGTWKNESTGEIDIDMSTICATEKEATEIGAPRGEAAIYSLDANKTLDLQTLSDKYSLDYKKRDDE